MVPLLCRPLLLLHGDIFLENAHTVAKQISPHFSPNSGKNKELYVIIIHEKTIKDIHVYSCN